MGSPSLPFGFGRKDERWCFRFSVVENEGQGKANALELDVSGQICVFVVRLELYRLWTPWCSQRCFKVVSQPQQARREMQVVRPGRTSSA